MVGGATEIQPPVPVLCPLQTASTFALEYVHYRWRLENVCLELNKNIDYSQRQACVPVTIQTPNTKWNH